MHKSTDESKALREKIFEYVRVRMDYDPIPLDYPKTEEELVAEAGFTITETGLGGDEALKLFEEVLAPATISTDHPGFVSFIPNAATEAASLFDLVVSASSIYGGSWMEGAGAVFAENQVLEWFASEVGLPKGAGGAFVQGGTIGNLSALATARQAHREKLKQAGVNFEGRLSFISSKESHSSLKAAAKKIELLVGIVQVIPVVFVPSYKKIHFEVRYGVGQCILRTKKPFVRGNVARHFTSIEVEGNCEIVEVYEIFNIFVQRE
jgi:hypothetical protein